MRDLVLTAVIFGAVPFIFKRPWLGVLLWTWIGMMNPHRLTWGFAYSLPFAAIVGLATLVALLISKEPKRFPAMPVTITLILLVVWENVTFPFAVNPTGEPFAQWDKVMKIHLFMAVTLIVMQTEQRIRWLVWVATFSIAFFGIKGGYFTLITGGGSMVLGPDQSFIAGNTEISLAITMVMPLLWYLRTQSGNRWVRLGFVVAIALCAVAVLGSYSRGGMLAVAAMGGFLWLKSRNKAVIGILLLALIPPMLGFMPDKWFDRMNTIGTYEQDSSAMGRVNAWHMAFNLAKDRPLVGGGMEAFTEEAFLRWAPNPLDAHDAHSIWFEMLGEQGFVGLAIFLCFHILVWRLASSIIRDYKGRSELRWATDLAAMIQASLVGYWVGGSFLGLAYWDLPYLLASILVLTKVVIDRQLVAGPSGGRPPSNATAPPGLRQNV